MADYTELVKALRDDNACTSVKTLHEAADAIEKLVVLVGRYKDVCDKMAANIDKLRDLCKVLYYQNKTLQEPPKEKQTFFESLKTGLEQAINGEYREKSATKEE